MTKLNSILFKRSLKQFLDCDDLNDKKGLALTEKISASAASDLDLILEALVIADEPHFSALKRIYQRHSKDFSEDFFLDKLADEETIIRATTSEILSGSANIDADKLFAQLHRSGASQAEIIEVLSFQKQTLKPEDIINNAVKIDSSYAVNLLSLIGDSTVDIDLNKVRFQTEKISDPEFKVTLLRYLCTVEQPEVGQIIVRFLADTNKTIVLEALYSLSKITVKFDASIILPFIPAMSGKEQELGLEVLTRQADTELVSKLVPFVSEKSDILHKFVVETVANHADKQTLEKFFLQLEKEDAWTRNQIIEGLQNASNPRLITVAKQLVDHKQAFVKTAAHNLILKKMDAKDIEKIGELALSDDWQVRERAIQILGKSANRDAVNVLKKVISKYPESSLTILSAVKQLGISKGMEIGFKCLNSKDESIQRAALQSIASLTTAKHAELVCDTIGSEMAGFGPGTTKTARQVRDRLIAEFGLKASPVETGSQNHADVPTGKASPTSKLDSIGEGSVWMGRYHIIKEIGRGAMGRVMLAEDDVIEEKLILKFMHPELTIEADTLERFKREVKYTRKVSHPNIIRVHDFLLQDQLCAISMEYFESEGLDVILREAGILDIPDGLQILLQVASGMTASHEQVVIHRDLKPSNILIDTNGRVKIVDFGIASAASGAESTLTQTGSIIGSPAFMSPERASGNSSDYRSDIYALGVITYYMMSGRLPYRGKPMEVLKQHCEGNAVPVAEVNPAITAPIAKLVHKMMALDPDARPPSMNAIRDELKSILERKRF